MRQILQYRLNSIDCTVNVQLFKIKTEQYITIPISWRNRALLHFKPSAKAYEKYTQLSFSMNYEAYATNFEDKVF